MQPSTAECGEVRSTCVEPEATVAWEGERASGTVPAPTTAASDPRPPAPGPEPTPPEPDPAPTLAAPAPLSRR